MQKMLLIKKARDLKIKFGIDNIPIENKRLLSVYWMPKV